MRQMILVSMLLVFIAGCGTQGEPEEITKADAEDAKADGDTSWICDIFGAPRDCDVCEVADWYGDGVCDEFCDDDDPDCACGGFAGLTCDDDEYCDYPDGAMCGAADQTGVCRPRPGDCTYAAPDPVCGCDGETYVSDCQANLNGVDFSSRGACGGEETICGGFLGQTCADDEYCEYEDEANCGIADQSGVCRPRPGDCTYASPDPVCGCDGVTYVSDCQANLNGVDFRSRGACESTGDCRTDGCEEGRECQFCWGSYQCIPEGAMC